MPPCVPYLSSLVTNTQDEQTGGHADYEQTEETEERYADEQPQTVRGIVPCGALHSPNTRGTSVGRSPTKVPCACGSCYEGDARPVLPPKSQHRPPRRSRLPRLSPAILAPCTVLLVSHTSDYSSPTWCADCCSPRTSSARSSASHSTVTTTACLHCPPAVLASQYHPARAVAAVLVISHCLSQSRLHPNSNFPLKR